MEQPRDVLVRFHEIGLKGKNQPMFVRSLVDNLRRATAGLGVENVWSTRMLVRMRLSPTADQDAVIRRAGEVFGAVKINVVSRVDPTYQDIAACVLEQAREQPFSTFRITANRTDKAFPLTSYELNTRLGDEVREATGAQVSLRNPEVNFSVQVARQDAFVYTKDYPGAGGLPVGTAGKVAVMMSGGIDSPVAAWRMLRRGCRAVLVHFHAFPLVEGRSRDKAKELAERLNAYQYDTRLYLVPFADVQRRVILDVPGPLRVVAYRRFMVRITEAIARKEKAHALVTGESVGQVGSQTLVNIATVDQSAALPILRPLIGMDKTEIIEQARAIGTYETSILPDEDCCTLFVPRSPSTAVRVHRIADYEAALDVESLVRETAAASEIIEYHAPASSPSNR